MIPIFKPYMPKNVMPELEALLYSGKLAYGCYGKAFESSLSDYIGNPYVLTVSSYKQAMLMAITILDLKVGDEVIASPVSCLASNQPFITKGIKVVWADVEPETGALSVDDVKTKITSKTKAIFHNHFCGYIGHIAEINQLAKEYGIWVVDDAIEAFGSESEGKKIGNMGTDLTVFSFQTVRLPNTIDGAAITFNNPVFYEKAIKVRDYGIDRSDFRLKNGEINPDHDITLEGYGATMNEVSSLIGLQQMPDINRLIHLQRSNAQGWQSRLAQHAGVKPLIPIDNTLPNFWVYGVLCDNKNEAINAFRDSGWYATGVHINNNLYSVFGTQPGLEGVNQFMEKFLALPCGWWVNQE